MKEKREDYEEFEEQVEETEEELEAKKRVGIGFSGIRELDGDIDIFSTQPIQGKRVKIKEFGDL